MLASPDMFCTIHISLLQLSDTYATASGASRASLSPSPPLPTLPPSNIVMNKHAMCCSVIVHVPLQICSQQWCHLSAATISHQEGMPECLLVKALAVGGQNKHSRLWSSCQMATASVLQSRKTLLGVQQDPAAMPHLALPALLCQTGQQLSHA